MTATKELRNWIRDAISGEEEVSLPALVDEAVAHFGTDNDFLNTFFAERARDIIYQIATQLLASSRHQVLMGDNVVSREDVAKRAKGLSIFANYREHCSRGHVRLLDMTKTDLLEAASEREQRGTTELRIAKGLRMLAVNLNDGQTVGTLFSDEDIAGALQNNQLPRVSERTAA